MVSQFPPDFPRPNPRVLINQYFTPTVVCDAVARALRPLLAGLPALGAGNTVEALEPSIGVGRFVRAAIGPGFERLRWHGVEYDAVSAAMVEAMLPDVDMYGGPFERWVAERGAAFSGRVGLVLANPPYGKRGPSKTEDPNRAYRNDHDGTNTWAAPYFLRRALDLLAPGGLGVFVIPWGFLSGIGKEARTLRETVLRRHHLSVAFRLPTDVFPGAGTTTDLLFFRSRGGELPKVDPADAFILDGTYFAHNKANILGEDRSDPNAKFWQDRYRVVGTFTGLPELTERPMCDHCGLVPAAPPAPGAPHVAAVPLPVEGEEAPELRNRLLAASALGARVDRYLEAVAHQDYELGALTWRELHDSLGDWATVNGPPSELVPLVQLARDDVGAARFIGAFQRGTTELIAGLREPPVFEPRYTGRPGDVVALAAFLHRRRHSLTLAELEAELGGPPDLAPLFALDWAQDEGQLVPPEVYYFGELWPRYDRAKVLADRGDAQAAAQAAKLMGLIRPVVFEQIKEVSPRFGWVPLDLVEQWLALMNRGQRPELVRVEGLVQLKDRDYLSLDNEIAGVSQHVINAIAWINHDRSLFQPDHATKNFETGDYVKVALAEGADPVLAKVVSQADDGTTFEVAVEDELNTTVPASRVTACTLDEVRIAVGQMWAKHFRAWCERDPARRERIVGIYQRAFQGFRAAEYSSAPLAIARWTKTGPHLHPYQIAGVRRMSENNGGLLFFDVGLGKTFTGCAYIALARQEGRARRPVVLAPNSLALPWLVAFSEVLPDYRVGLIGVKMKRLTRGPRKGQLVAVTDSAADRAATWARFQAGEFDVVIMTKSSLSRTRMDEESVAEYVNKTTAIKRSISLHRRNVQRRERRIDEGGKGTLSERDNAILTEAVGAFVAEVLELPRTWKYDPGITWEKLGIDCVVVDEVQDEKNLFMPEEREGGIPRYMGNPGKGSNRAWQLSVRAATVRRKTGGSGVLGMTATPFMNGPLELYSIVGYVAPDAFEQLKITDPEAFLDTFCEIELKNVINSSGEVVPRAAVTGFKNLDQIRNVVNRYGLFRTARQVGLKIPEGEPHMIEVPLNDEQEKKYVAYLRKMEKIKSAGQGGSDMILGLMARLNLVAIHPRLDESTVVEDADGQKKRRKYWTWENAATIDDPHSPKLDRVAAEILKRPHCGNVVFCENVAVHQWLKMVLIEAGIPAERIAILNAEAVPDLDKRQRIALEFNGSPEYRVGGEIVAAVEPLYDVLIGNAIMATGVNLQTRTCAGHHIDLPFGPSTLHQRNGRYVRQGNKSALADNKLPINYYIALMSLDGLRFDLIMGKLRWMTTFLEDGGEAATKNPGADMELDPEEVLQRLSRDPEGARARAEAARAGREEAKRVTIAKEASATLRSAAAQFARARVVADPHEAATLRSQAEVLLRDLARYPAAAWPWFPWADAARDHAMLVPPAGHAPAYTGLRVAYPNVFDSRVTEYIEFGRVVERSIGARRPGSAAWKLTSMEELAAIKLRPEHRTTPIGRRTMTTGSSGGWSSTPTRSSAAPGRASMKPGESSPGPSRRTSS